MTLPVAAVYAIGIWAIAMFGGSPSFFAWPQMACYVAASYMMVELNNRAHIRTSKQPGRPTMPFLPLAVAVYCMPNTYTMYPFYGYS